MAKEKEPNKEKSKNKKVIISPVTGLVEKSCCRNVRKNGFSSHCKTCGLPIVF